MAGATPPGPLGTQANTPQIDPGTSAPIATPAPGPVAAAVITPEQPKADAEIEALDLAKTAREAAYALKKAHPAVKFTSGRRSKEDQARAMAGNVVSKRKWIEETYAQSALRKSCQDWVDAHPDQKTQAEIAAGLLSVLDSATDKELGGFSRHLSGEAFDVQPVEQDAEAIKATIRGLAGLVKFLDSEGGLVRWHAQF